MDASTYFVGLMKKHLSVLKPNQRFAYLVRLLWGSPYGWGKEVMGDVDCSGSVCWSLYLLGYNIRMTADDFYRLATNPTDTLPEPGNLCFWWFPTRKRIKHVTVFSDKMVVMDADEHFQDIPVSLEIQTREKQPFEFRKFDWNKLKVMSDTGEFAWGVDSELKPLFGLFEIS